MDYLSISHINFSSLLFHFLLIIYLTNAALEICYNTGNFTANSTYAENRGLLLSYLASNVTENGGFYAATAGQGTDKVFGLVLCRGDTPSEQCPKCVNTAIAKLIEKCPNQKEALLSVGEPPCFARYANRSIVGLLELNPTDAGYNVNNIASNMEEFDEIWSSLMARIVARASRGSSKVKFATEEANLTPTQKIYALMQCTPDISEHNCSYCLRETLGYYRSSSYGKQGVHVNKPSCIFRWELYPFYNSIADAPTLSPSPPPPPPPANNTTTKGNGATAARTVVIITAPTIFFAALVGLACSFFYYRSCKKKTKNLEEISSTECLKFNFETIRLATNDFSDNNKLGQGGFGAVYKGVLPDGQVVAIKRLTTKSKQGEVDFKNEVMLVARLQHRNLVRLLGFCFERNERLLIYEFLTNSSLDHFIYDQEKRLLMDWNTRYKIIVGIARGILYLHQDSQLRVIHRDLKVGNILLDEQMNPKISDFGTARLFPTNQSEDATSKIMGTFGYMAPEYVFHGIVSAKSDVFSFGVLILEIISGKSINKFRNDEGEGGNLLTYAWKNWNAGTASKIIDPVLVGAASTNEILRCVQIGLLCIQEDAAKRPTMASVILMLDSCSAILSELSRPAYFLHGQKEPITIGTQSAQPSANQCSISEMEPR
ncbi:putative receptor-like protein kinase At4g00960 [Manihot esculenta]|uniref:Uncharacterized protein n=1 Tax=Manihot esculenta TaxID=3983 RepID=A0A2C9U7Z2_MANES|nr:putative receptor-like protein kinase At4g00960 [Manihot esculenta]OAY26011.1 hypothetical protein MANES_16G014500v8 [Manihot esculenta]